MQEISVTKEITVGAVISFFQLYTSYIVYCLKLQDHRPDTIVAAGDIVIQARKHVNRTAIR
jgi:hypothetical protein